jgi:phenylpropionate dioxygenase-like ring-hydroxylating dioxygenase large terminal subunit
MSEKSAFRSSWYPIVLSHLLKVNEPYGIQILGDPVVLFRDKNGKVRTVEEITLNLLLFSANLFG